MKLTVRTGRTERELTLKRASVEIPVVEGTMEREGGRKIAHVRLASFTSGAHGEVGEAVDRLLARGAEGVVFDLRDNGGGLLNEAVLISSVFIPDGRIVSTKGRSRPERVYDATGGAIDEDIPVVVLVNERSASASEIVTGALQDRERATVVGTKTFGKGVFQEIEPLSNGGALDITVGEYFLPSGRNLGGGGVERGSGVKPDVRAEDDPETPQRDEGLEAALRAVGVNGSPVVALLEKRGRFYTATPFFARGRRINVDKPRPGAGGHGDLVLVAPTGRGGGHGKIVRRIGRPDVARDVLEALMLDRGLRRRFDPLVEREAREAPERVADVRRLDLRALPTFTIDPPTARDFDDAISAERLDDGAVRVWVHIADVSAHVPPGSAVDREAFRRGTSVYVPGLVEPMLPEALSNRACSLVPHQDRLAVTVELELVGREGAPDGVPPHADPLRHAARRTRRSTRSSPAASAAQAPWAEPLAAARQAAAALQEQREAKGALEVDSEEPEFAFSGEGHVTALVPSEQTESHRVIEHLMIAANEAVATLLETRKLPALFRVHEQPEPLRVRHLADQLAALDVPTPPLPDTMSPQQAGDAVAEIARLVTREVRRREGRGRIAFTSLVLRSLKQAHYSPRNVGHAGLRSPRYCHFTSPIRRYPDLVCHRALLSAIGAGEEPPAASRLEEQAELVLGARARRDVDRAHGRLGRALLPARAGAVRAGLAARVGRRGHGRDRGGRVRRVRRRARGHAADAAAAARLVGARRAGDDAAWARRAGRRSASATRSRCRSSGWTQPRGRVDLSPVEL